METLTEPNAAAPVALRKIADLPGPRGIPLMGNAAPDNNPWGEGPFTQGRWRPTGVGDSLL